MTVREVPTVRQVHPQDLISILERREIYRHVCLRAAVRLHIGVIGAKQLLRAIDCGLLDDVGPLTPAVVTFTRIAFCVLVCKHRSTSCEYVLAYEILGSDQLKHISLPRYFSVDGAGHHRIDFSK